MTLPLANLVRRDPRQSILVVGGVVGITGFIAVMSWAIEHTDYDVWGGILVALALGALSYPLLRRVTRVEADARVAKLFVAALVLKLGASLVRYWVAFGLYDGVADAGAYHDAGVALASSIRSGIYTADIGSAVVGTGFIKILTGVIYTFTGASQIGGFLVFAWLGFWGLYLFYRAFSIGCPGGDRRRYAYLVFLLPSMLFWPSSIGKEAWMTLTLGTIAYGAARLLTGARFGGVCVALGLVGTSLVRPHMSVVVMAGLLVGYVLRRAPSSSSSLRPVYKLGGVAVLLVMSMVAVTQTQRFFDVETVAPESVEQVLEHTADQTGQGGSAFETAPVRSPRELPAAVLAVMFRPFPTEASNAQTLIASIEGSLLLLGFVVSWRRVVRAPLVMLHQAYVAFACTYAVVFIVAFSNVANFGIIVRQRVQLLPFALVLLALPQQAEPANPQPLSSVLPRVPSGRSSAATK